MVLSDDFLVAAGDKTANDVARLVRISPPRGAVESEPEQPALVENKSGEEFDTERRHQGGNVQEGRGQQSSPGVDDPDLTRLIDDEQTPRPIPGMRQLHGRGESPRPGGFRTARDKLKGDGDDESVAGVRGFI